MLTLRSAAALLAAARDIDSLAPIAALLGFAAEPAPLGITTREGLGVPTDVADVRVAAGPGTLRALLVASEDARPLRELIAVLARRLASRAPHILWMVLAVDREGEHVGLAVWSADRSPPRVAALLVDRARVTDSDAETLCALAVAGADVDVLTHARWLDVLGRDALTRRFYRALERVVAALAAAASGRAAEEDRRAIALLYVSRLLFLSYLEVKGWLDGDRAFLLRGFERCMGTGGGYQHRVLLPLFFGTLNTPVAKRAAVARSFGRIPFLNGGLFTRTPLEQRCRALAFPDAALGAVFGELLTRYRFTAREDSSTWSEAAVDPEMLGRAFESLMGSPERRSSGTYYTPHALVERVTAEALREALTAPGIVPDDVDRALDGERPAARVASLLRARIASLRVLDPACGSGAFLVHALERLGALLRTLGDERPPSDVRRAILASSIFGVDVSPTAVWLCELRLWLSTIVEIEASDPMRVPPLPNLDHHIHVGDSLAGGSFRHAAVRATDSRRVATLRARYSRAVGARKHTLARMLDREERAAAIAALDRELARLRADRTELLVSLRGRDLFGERALPSRAQRDALGELRRRARACRERRRALADGAALAFSFAARFPDVAAAGGFDLVVGNPPWVRLHRIPADARAALRREFGVYRDAAWEAGAAGAHAGRGFAAQVDLAALFVERSLELLREGAPLALIVPAKLWRSLAGGGVRRLLAGAHTLRSLEDWSESRSGFDAAVYPSVLVATRGRADNGLGTQHGGVDGPQAADAALLRDDKRTHYDADVRLTVHRRDSSATWSVPAHRLALDDTPGSPWLVVPAEVRDAFDRIARAGVPLASSHLGRPLLGVKTGCNEAFLVTAAQGNGPLAEIRAGERGGRVERELLRPALRGETIARWRAEWDDEAILWPHAPGGKPLDELPRLAGRWLAPWRDRLVARADARTRGRWWSLFRIEGAACDRPRVVWPDVARVPRALVLDAGDPTVPTNTCYVVRCSTLCDAHALAALLNSPLAAAWLDVLAEPARGGYHRYLGWTMALLPIPRDWPRALTVLAPLAARAISGCHVSAAELTAAALRAYRLRAASVAPLLEWAAR